MDGIEAPRAGAFYPVGCQGDIAGDRLAEVIGDGCVSYEPSVEYIADS